MIDILIGMHMIKYKVLDEIIEFDPEEEYVNLYIDMHTILSKFYKKNNNPDIINYNQETYQALISSIYNTIAHYRRYLHKHGKSNRIFLVLDRKIPSYQSKLIPFGQTYFDRYSPLNESYKEINNMFSSVFESLRSLTRYFKGIYFIETEGIDDVTKMHYLMTKYKGQNIVLSKYDYFYQLVANPKTTILFPKRDSSYVINQDNFFDKLLIDVKCKPKNLNHKIFPIYMMIQGIKCRDIPSMNIKKRVKLIELLDLMVTDGYITNDVSVQSFLTFFSQLTHGTSDNASTMVRRYQALCANLNVNALTTSQINQIENCIVDLYDENSIEKLNNIFEEKFNINYLDLYKADAPNKKTLTRKGWD